MIRLVAVLTLFAALIGVAIAEQVCIEKTYSHMERETAAIIEIVRATPDVDNKAEFDDYLKVRFDDLHHYWSKKERRLGIIIKHIDLSYISDALIYARNFVHTGNKEEAIGGLSRLEYLLTSYHAVYGLNGVNIL
ncbi:MAG: DUF4363 family protein [Christensenellaceae bacterium]|jgi:hypothetical protein|nr:DUF4363 family protein [Christensenellaceae bacterium]